MFGVYEKLHLQRQDAIYILSQVKSAVQKKLDLHLPRVSKSKQREFKRKRLITQEQDEETDPVRSNVKNLLDTYINETFELAKFSLVIDGTDFGNSDSFEKFVNDPKRKKIETESFDFELNEKLKKLYYEVEDLTSQITKKRREIPNQLQQRYREVSERNLKCIEDMEGEVATLEQEALTEDDETIDTLGQLNFQNESAEEKADMIEEYEKSLGILLDLKDRIPERKDSIDKLFYLMKYVEENSKKANT